MLGDNFRRMQADELDADWDRLVRNEQGSNGDVLSMISGELNALIPPANLGAKSRVCQQIFADSWRGTATSRNQSVRRMAAQSMPFNPRHSERTKRLCSSPMAALEAVIACLVIAALALGISVYQLGNDSNPSGQSFNAAESTPDPLPTPDWTEFREMQAAAQPTLTFWDGAIGAGRIVVNLSEVYFPVNTGYSANFIGVNLVSVLRGTVTLTTDSGEPIELKSGDTSSAYVSGHFSIHNSGSDMAYFVHGMVYQESATFSNDVPDTFDYYPYFLGNAIVDVPTDLAAVSLEIIDETTVNRTVRSNATELFLTRLGAVSLVVTGGEVGVRGTGTTTDEYRTGGGYFPIALGSTTVLSESDVLIQPGSVYSFSAPISSDVLAISLRVEGQDSIPVESSP